MKDVGHFFIHNTNPRCRARCSTRSPCPAAAVGWVGGLLMLIKIKAPHHIVEIKQRTTLDESCDKPQYKNTKVRLYG